MDHGFSIGFPPIIPDVRGFSISAGLPELNRISWKAKIRRAWTRRFTVRWSGETRCLCRPTNKKYIPYHPCVWYVYLHVVNLYGKCWQKIPSSWWFQPIWKIWVKIGIFPKGSGWNFKKYLKPPPRKFSRRKNFATWILKSLHIHEMGSNIMLVSSWYNWYERKVSTLSGTKKHISNIGIIREDIDHIGGIFPKSCSLYCFVPSTQSIGGNWSTPFA